MCGIISKYVTFLSLLHWTGCILYSVVLHRVFPRHFPGHRSIHKMPRWMHVSMRWSCHAQGKDRRGTLCIQALIACRQNFVYKSLCLTIRAHYMNYSRIASWKDIVIKLLLMLQVILVKWNEPYQKLASCDSSGIIFVWIKYEGRWSIELINDRNTPVTHFSWSHDGRMALICYQVRAAMLCRYSKNTL